MSKLNILTHIFLIMIILKMIKNYKISRSSVYYDYIEAVKFGYIIYSKLNNICRQNYKINSF